MSIFINVRGMACYVFITIQFLTFFLISCQITPKERKTLISTPVLTMPGGTTVNYTPATDLFPNPERGFYHYTATHSNKYKPLVFNRLQRYRQNENITLIFRYFYLDDFVNNDISDTYLTAMQIDFDIVREAGLKVIVRFAYTDHLPPAPPYNDASKAQILKHIEQLQPVLQANSDVIAVVQAGFIGVWGEWYYTDHCIKGQRNLWNITTKNYVCRGEILNAILDALPTDRMVQLRTPRYKYNLFNNTVDPSPLPVPLQITQAHTGSDMARTGHHNDCFLSSVSDSGTYLDPPTDQRFLEAETKYLVMGGETCNHNESRHPDPARLECDSALREMEKFHWSYLNLDYYKPTLQHWRDTGCFAEIKQRLGYRFKLIQGAYTDEVRQGDAFNIEIILRNEGWAAPFNPRLVKLLLRHKTREVMYQVTLPDDPRFWLADNKVTYSVSHAICTPADILPGEYELLLNLPDPQLVSLPEYAIRFANENVWENDTGFNKLLHNMTINGDASNSVCDSALYLSNEALFN